MDKILVDRADGVVTITINQPAKKNAMAREMWQALEAECLAIRQSDTDRAVVLTGAGGEFCSGADLWQPPREGPPRHQIHAMRAVSAAVLALHQLPQPTLARVDGIAAGAGLSLALGCDLIVASERARFSEIFAKRGLAVDGGSSWLLPRLIGLHRAKELAFFADILDAAEAERIGLVNRVVPTDELDAVVAEWATRLRNLPPIAISLTKRLLNDSMSVTMEQALEDEARAQVVNFSTQDTPEAFQAFLDKREPVFRGF